jgi:hypothetical protein
MSTLAAQLLIAQSRRLIAGCERVETPNPELHITFNDDTPEKTRERVRQYIETVYNYKTRYMTVWSVKLSSIEVLVVSLDNNLTSLPDPGE